MQKLSFDRNDAKEAEGFGERSLACLVLIAKSHGIQLSREQLIRDGQLDVSKLGMREIIDCAVRAGLKSKTIKLNWRELVKLKRSLPAIILLKNMKPMVIANVESGQLIEKITLVDPDARPDYPLILDRVQLEQIWDGRIVLFKKNYSLNDEEQPFTLGLVAALMFRERRIMRDIVIAAIFLSVLTLVPILFFRLMTDRVLMHHALNTYAVLCIALGICIIFETVFSTLRRSLMTHLNSRLDVKLNMIVFERVLRQPVSLFENTPVGLIARNMGEVTKIKSFISNILLGTFLDSVCLLIYIPVMFIFSTFLTSVVLICCGLIVAWTVAMLPTLSRRTSEVIAAEGYRGSFLIQTLQGIRTIKSLALEPRQLQQYEVHVARSALLRARESNIINLIQSAILPVERFMISGTLAIGVYIGMTTTDTSAVAEIFIFLLLSQRVIGPMRQMAQLVEQYEEAKSSVGLVGSLVNNPPESLPRSSGVREKLIGRVEFCGVKFQYIGSSRPALEDVTFELAPGTTLGIMGRSGSGKTTVTRLLQRLHDEYDGLIKIDGIDVREYALDHLRSSLGVVLQDNFLFAGSIRDNICAAKTDASFDEVVRSARLAGAEEFIDRLPRGYETFINEGSTNISGGQRQRIAIARALITNPRVLILDEATSALDPDSEAIVNANLKRISEGRTVIVISHRLTSLVSSDAILVLEQGRVHDIGKHLELINRCDIYRDLWNQQNGTVNSRADNKIRLVS